jgi:hypothetical protein
MIMRWISEVPSKMVKIVDYGAVSAGQRPAQIAVEARYLPNLDPEFIQLSNVPDVADWAEYRAGFDPVQTQAWLSYPSEKITQDAEFLLLMRAHRRDPVGDDWSQLMRRAPAKSRSA